MALSISQNLTQRSYQWTAWKGVKNVKSFSCQFDEDAETYTVYGYDGPEVHLCKIWKGAVPDGVLSVYSQEQNDADKADFETHYKDTANWPLEKREKDGRLVARISTATSGHLFRLRAYSFKTCNPSTLHNCKPDGSSYGDVTITEFDGNGDVITGSDFTASVKTYIDFEAQQDIELIGGWSEIDDSIHGSGMGAWYLSCIAAPDVPAQYGGCIDFISEADLGALQDKRIVTDGRSSALIKYDPTYHSGKIRIIIKHPAGVQKDFQFFMETFR